MVGQKYRRCGQTSCRVEMDKMHIVSRPLVAMAATILAISACDSEPSGFDLEGLNVIGVIQQTWMAGDQLWLLLVDEEDEEIKIVVEEDIPVYVELSSGSRRRATRDTLNVNMEVQVWIGVWLLGGYQEAHLVLVPYQDP
jgi:hypothetical protein